jgi:hypothetical protein
MRHLARLAICILVAGLAPRLSACDACACSSQTVSGPLLSLGTRGLPRHATLLGLRVDWMESRRWSDARIQSRALTLGDAHSMDRTVATFLTVAHGVTPHLTLSARLAWIDRVDIRGSENDSGVATDVEKHGDASGVADTLLSAQWQFLDLPAKGLAASAFVAVETPTGKDHVRARGGERFDPDHQPGSGSWDPWLGLAVSKDWGHDSVSAATLWQGSGGGELGCNLGSALQASLGYIRSLHPMGRRASSGTDVIVDLAWESHARPLIAGEKEPHGGSAVWLSPGMRFRISPKWSAFATVRLPLSQDPRAGEQDAAWRAVSGFGFVMP